ncbi:hypothetical protein [Rhizobium sp. Leaf453]|uniref:hypothetical protein n=1 Tax=Rhizobium sp. Leaf453 TaxID=1736380 RepID=UPI0012E39B23|nr:hypothetical protein [Rhizobium sp. Leaf453]
MTEKPTRRPRGASPRGNFEKSKSASTDYETERMAAQQRKSEALRKLRLEAEKKGDSV